MEKDDAQIGRIVSRREALGLIGAGGAALLAGSSSVAGSAAGPLRLPSCIVRPRQTAGPYFVDTMLERSDIRSDPTDGSIREGSPLSLAFHVSQIGADGCAPMPGALVDIWQCDALGIYSGVEDIAGLFDTTGKQFLRGHQVTDDAGAARFTTIFPGWYPGRTAHIHFMIRSNPSAERGHEFVSQLYFDDGLADRVYENAPYSEHTGSRQRNGDDGPYRGGGDQLLLDVTEHGAEMSAVFDVGLQIGPTGS